MALVPRFCILWTSKILKIWGQGCQFILASNLKEIIVDIFEFFFLIKGQSQNKR